MSTFISHSAEDEHFHPESKHSIWTGGAKPFVFGGVLHAVATISGAQDGRPVNTSTFFYAKANPDEPVTVTRNRIDSSRVTVVTLTQGDRLIAHSNVLSSTDSQPDGVVTPTVTVPQFRESEWDWGIGGADNIWDYLKGWFRRGGAMMWLEGHDIDLAASAVLADFGTINLAHLVGRFGSTQSLVTHWFTGAAFEKVYLTHQIEGRAYGNVITRLDQYNEHGTPICATRMTAQLDAVPQIDFLYGYNAGWAA